MKESSQLEIELKDTAPDAFKILLKYVYAGQIKPRLLKQCFGSGYGWIWNFFQPNMRVDIKEVFFKFVYEYTGGL